MPLNYVTQHTWKKILVTNDFPYKLTKVILFLDMICTQWIVVAVIVVSSWSDLTVGYEIEGESDFENFFGKRRKSI